MVIQFYAVKIKYFIHIYNFYFIHFTKVGNYISFTITQITDNITSATELYTPIEHRLHTVSTFILQLHRKYVIRVITPVIYLLYDIGYLAIFVF